MRIGLLDMVCIVWDASVDLWNTSYEHVTHLLPKRHQTTYEIASPSKEDHFWKRQFRALLVLANLNN